MLSKLIRYLPIIIGLYKFISKLMGKRAHANTSRRPLPSGNNTSEWDKLDGPSKTSQGLDSKYSDSHSSASGGIEKLYKNRTSDTIVTDQGTIVHILPDDLEGDKHQKFIVQIARDLTILIAHNIDMAERVPARKGDFIRFKGEYEWDQRGGIMHWTHHDPKGWHEDGWIEHDGHRIS